MVFICETHAHEEFGNRDRGDRRLLTLLDETREAPHPALGRHEDAGIEDQSGQGDSYSGIDALISRRSSAH